ncbi:limonene-1,2-epoxide hydrolase family protein [Rhodococcus oxybenzonivorans]|uniref:nuclear transport factor 2 family protein n=1 Tax=Rhodococcus TaxID=1827 RepID=UPI00202DC1D9|nr:MULTISPECIES: limonene-1,2-epoxide hydrolase family protein [Rhodococcus]MDV7357499.1 limonene-1,2-epoxide hydrolase family protein [Rhodococcus oxybenzonivorans]
MSPDELVTQFCAEWSDPDPAAIAEYFSEDAVYHNIPMEPVCGREEIREFVAGFVAAFGGIEFRVQRQVGSVGSADDAGGNGGSGVIMNERVDVFDINDTRVELPVVGVFEIADGKITAWRDYFDMAPIQAATAGG